MDTPPARGLTAAIVSLLLLCLSWELTAALFIGRWLFGPGWFGPCREWVALGVSMGLLIQYQLWGRRLMRQHYRVAHKLTLGQAVIVVILMVGAGAFGTWLFCRR